MKVARLGRCMALLAMLGVTGMMHPASAQNQGQYGQHQDSGRKGGVKFGLTSPWRCDEVEDRTGCEFGSTQIWVPLMREDSSVFNQELCERLRCRPTSSVVVIKVKPCSVMWNGREKYIGFEHFNPKHHPGDEKIYDACVSFFKEVKRLNRPVYVSFAPDANEPGCRYFAGKEEYTPADYRMAYQKFWEAAIDAKCRNALSMWSISRPYAGCVSAHALYPGKDWVDAHGGTVYYKPEWYDGWNQTKGHSQAVGDMYHQLQGFDRDKPCIIETGRSRDKWSGDSYWQLANDCRGWDRLEALICNDEDEGWGNWRFSDCNNFGDDRRMKEVVDCFHGKR